VWDEVWLDEYDRGYLAAAFDGEGCLMFRSEDSGKDRRGFKGVQFSQRDNAMWGEVQRMLGVAGFRYSVAHQTQSTLSDKGYEVLRVLGGRAEGLRFLGEIRPKRLLNLLDPAAIGGLRIIATPTLVEKRDVGLQEVVSLQTSTRTFIAEGLASHNCTIAGVVHALMAWNLLVNESDAIPTDPEIKTTYFGQTGGGDTGLVETTLLQTWVSDGLFGAKIPAWAPVPHTNVEAIKQSVYFYGACYLGVQLPQSAQQQFVQGGNSTWSVVPGSPIEGGHAILAVGYGPEGLYIVSWGQVVLCTWEWVAKYLDEAYAILSRQFVEAGKGPTLDLAALTADLNQV
jgi:hypothetical protein